VTHSGAVANNLVEKYLLRELDEAEREEFEIHFFSCPECTTDLQDASLIVEGARRTAARPPVAVPERRKPQQSSWWTLFPARFAFPAMALLSTLLAVWLGQQNRAVRQELSYYQQPRQIAEFTLLPATRGPVPVFDVPRDAREIQFSMDIASDQPFVAYRCEIRNLSGARPVSMPLKVAKPGQPVQVAIPAPPADSELQIRLSGVTATSSESEIFSQPVRLHLLH
jgi:hypothetical protein